MPTTFSPTPIPEPVNPPPRPSPQPPPDPAIPTGANGEAGNHRQPWQDAPYLGLPSHAFWILAWQGVSPDGPFPLVCTACNKPVQPKSWLYVFDAWPSLEQLAAKASLTGCCPQATWAADWVLSAHRLGLLDIFGLKPSDDALAALRLWATRPAPVPGLEPVHG